jgi:fructose/tagatose bisphosphate aldolase
MAIAEEQDLDIILAQSRDAGSNTSGDGDVDPGDTDETDFVLLVQEMAETRQKFGAAFPDCLALHTDDAKDQEMIERAITVLMDQRCVLRSFEGRRE